MNEKEANEFLKQKAKELNSARDALDKMRWVVPSCLGDPKSIRGITYSEVRQTICFWVGLGYISFREGESLFHKVIPIVQAIKRIARETQGVTLRCHLGKVYFYKKDIPAFVARMNAILI